MVRPRAPLPDNTLLVMPQKRQTRRHFWRVCVAGKTCGSTDALQRIASTAAVHHTARSRQFMIHRTTNLLLKSEPGPIYSELIEPGPFSFFSLARAQIGQSRQVKSYEAKGKT